MEGKGKIGRGEASNMVRELVGEVELLGPAARHKQSSRSPISLGTIPREAVRDKDGNKSPSTIPFLLISNFHTLAMSWPFTTMLTDNPERARIHALCALLSKKKVSF